MENLQIYNSVRVVPEEAKKSINGGRLKGMTDINPMWRIQKMTEQFGVCGIGWKYSITKQWTEAIGQEVKAFVNIDLFVKVDGEWSDAIQGTGGSSFVSLEKSGLFVNDECYKMALTDALSVAMKALGVGADVYFANGVNLETKYSTQQEATQPMDPHLEFAIEEIHRAPTVEQLLDLYNELTAFRNDPRFLSELSKRKGELLKK